MDNGWPTRSPSLGKTFGGHRGGAAIVSEDGSETRYLAEDAGVVYVGWSLDGQTVYYRAFDSERGTSFWSVPVSGGEPTLLVPHFDPGVHHRPDMAVGSGRFFFTLTEHQSDIWVMELESQD